MSNHTQIIERLESGRLGGFVTRLYEAWLAADGHNKATLEEAFPIYFNFNS